MTCTNFATSFKTKMDEKPWVKCANCPLPKTETPVASDSGSDSGSEDQSEPETTNSGGDDGWGDNQDGWTTTESSSSGDWDSFRN